MIEKYIEISPIGYVRQTRADAWKKRPIVLRYREYRDALREQAGEFSEKQCFVINFYLPMPASWSKKKKRAMCLMPHQQKPDVDNLAKAFLDAIMADDSHVWSLKIRKFWADTGGIGIQSEDE